MGAMGGTTERFRLFNLEKLKFEKINKLESWKAEQLNMLERLETWKIEHAEKFKLPFVLAVSVSIIPQSQLVFQRSTVQRFSFQLSTIQLSLYDINQHPHNLENV